MYVCMYVYIHIYIYDNMHMLLKLQWASRILRRQRQLRVSAPGSHGLHLADCRLRSPESFLLSQSDMSGVFLQLIEVCNLVSVK